MAHKILIVDDEASVLFLVKQAFEGHCEVLTAQDGGTAIEMIKAERPVFVFLDITMPGMSGLEVLAVIRDLAPAPIIWMLTGDEDIETASLTLKGGAKGYITKPFDIDRLRSVVFNALLDLEKAKKPHDSTDKPWHVKKPKQ